MNAPVQTQMVSLVKGCSEIALPLGVLHAPPMFINENLVGDEVLDRVEDILVVHSDLRVVVVPPHVQRNTFTDRGVHNAVEQ